MEEPKNINHYLESSKGLVREDKERDWVELVLKNTTDPFAADTLEASIEVMRALSGGKSPEEARRTSDARGLSGGYANCMDSVVSEFHARGREYMQRFHPDWT